MKQGIKRFYDKVAVRHSPTSGHFAITLDGRDIKTPAKKLLQLPTEALVSPSCFKPLHSDL